ncbi:MAG: molybdate transport system ATP-binding protein [Gammaproteobacteria bacterium]|jgi:molybdate transport system ATP-binding protein
MPDSQLIVQVTQSHPVRIDVEFECDNNELVCLVGPSGSGKTTTLRLIAGLEKAAKGKVTCHNQVWLDSSQSIHQPTYLRKLGMVFQSYGLFPHLTVAEHIEISGLSKSDEHAELLDLVNLTGLESRKPHQLSGGQQQRLALARALSRKPDVLLLDEPFSAVDLVTRKKLRRELARIRRQLQIPVVMVTHDLEEAALLADRIVVMHRGRNLQIGPPKVLFEQPDNAEIARLIDLSNIFQGQVIRHDKLNNLTCIEWLGQQLDCVFRPEFEPGESIDWVIPENRVILHQRVRPSKGEAENPVEGIISNINPLGEFVEIDMLPDGSEDQSLTFSLPLHVAERNRLDVNESIGVSLDSLGIHLMHRDQ